MLNEKYKQFKSGTDIRGVAVEGVEGQSVNLTDEVIQKMADGFVLWLSKKLGKSPDRLKISDRISWSSRRSASRRRAPRSLAAVSLLRRLCL